MDKRIAPSDAALEFVVLMREIASDSLTAANARAALMPLAQALKSEEQSGFGQRPRGKLTETGDTLGDIIDRLAHRKDETAPELWPHLWAALDRLHLTPSDVEDRDDPRKSRYDYGNGKHITFGQFANRISEIRKKSG